MSTETAENILAYRKADLIISTVPVHNRSIVCTLFKTVESVLVCSSNHPRMVEHSTLEDIMREQFTLLITTQPSIREQQSAANNLFLNRKIGFSSDSLTSITNIIASTDIIGLIPKIIYEQNAAALNLKEISVDFKLPSVKLFLMYNRSSLNNKSFAEYIKTITP